MNIIITLPSFQIGGAENQIALLVRNLVQRAHEVTVVTFKEKSPFEVDIENSGATIVRLPIKGLFSGSLAALQFLLLTKQKKIKFIYSVLPLANIFSGLIGMLSPQIRIIWGIRSSFMPMEIYGIKLRVLYFLELKLIGLANGI